VGAAGKIAGSATYRIRASRGRRRRRNGFLDRNPLLVRASGEGEGQSSEVQGAVHAPLCGCPYRLEAVILIATGPTLKRTSQPPMSSSASSTPEPHGLEVLRTYGDGFAGRQEELKALDQAWNEGTRIFVFFAEGGAGKTRVVSKWLSQMRDDDYRGAGRVFVHSFYSQGSNEQGNASSAFFFEQALSYFGHIGPPLKEPTQQGRTLARLIREQHGLLVLDGLEPLQHPLSFANGRLKDPAIQSLLLTIAGGRLGDTSGSVPGLCVITSRQPVLELRDKEGKAVIQQPLDRMDSEAGAELLRQLEVRGPERELRQAVEDSRGHAYSLTLLGTYLRDATSDHEIRRRREIPLLAEDSEHRYHARHLFAAYMAHLGEASAEVAVLRLLGFFDRPAEERQMTVLREATASGIEAITAPLRNLSSEHWYRILSRLKALRLIDVPPSTFSPIDSHPLLREYSAESLRIHFTKAWQVGHQSLFKHLCRITEHRPSTLEGLQTLYQALAHGCLAGLYQEVFYVYRERMLGGPRDASFYNAKRFGTFGSDLGAISYFFTTPWTAVTRNIAPPIQAWLLAVAAFNLRTQGRLTEALEPMLSALKMSVSQNDWIGAAGDANNISELELTRGNITIAISTARQAVSYADRSGSIRQKAHRRATLANALHQAGHRKESKQVFEDAESEIKLYASEHWLFSVKGFQYCDLIMAHAERTTWQRFLLISPTAPLSAFDEARERAKYAVKITQEYWSHLAIGLDFLTLARYHLYSADIALPLPQDAHSKIALAVAGLRVSGHMDFLPHGLLTRALIRSLSNNNSGCREDLDEAWEIAERGPMPLFQADILLYRARLFRDRTALAEARRLIEKHGYHRRDEELADAEAAAEHWDDKEPSVPNKVFISYSHDSEQHSQRVLALANQLRNHGVDAELDQYETRPPQGWPQWCEEQLRPENSEYVLLVCTETYLQRIEGKVPAGEGLGVFWEGDIIYSYLYEQRSKERFIPILFDRQDEANIPRPLKGAAHFQLGAFNFSDSGYKSLYRELTHQPAVEKPPLGERVSFQGRTRGLPFGVQEDLTILPAVAPRTARSTPETDLLEELKRLPAAWFDELVFHFDTNGAVSTKPAPQAIRAIDLLTVVRALEEGPVRLREKILRLKENRG
jgi:hypothetical protein